MPDRKPAIMRNTWKQCTVEIDGGPDSLGRHHFTLDWIDEGGRPRGQCFFAKLEDHVLMTAADYRAEMQRRLGCVALRRARTTGSLVGMYRTSETDLDPEIGPWAVVCEVHHTILGVQTRAAGRSSMPDPEAFCDDCREAVTRRAFLGRPAGLMLRGSS